MEEQPTISKITRKLFLFLLIMGGRTRKVSFGTTDLGCNDRPFKLEKK